MKNTIERDIIDRYQAGTLKLNTQDDLNVSMSEAITIALAIDRLDLMPHGWQNDTLTAYKHRLDRGQRMLVKECRGWSL